MSLIVLLDAGPLGLITNPKSSSDNEACKNLLATSKRAASWAGLLP